MGVCKVFQTTDGALDRKAILSTLWIFVTLNYLYGDLAVMIFHPSMYQGMVVRMSESAVLGMTAVMEIPMAMVLLSRILKYRINRWANIIAGSGFTLFVCLTLLGKPPSCYLFLSLIEHVATLFIVWYAWTWRKLETSA